MKIKNVLKSSKINGLLIHNRLFYTLINGSQKYSASLSQNSNKISCETGIFYHLKTLNIRSLSNRIKQY